MVSPSGGVCGPELYIFTHPFSFNPPIHAHNLPVTNFAQRAPLLSPSLQSPLGVLSFPNLKRHITLLYGMVRALKMPAPLTSWFTGTAIFLASQRRTIIAVKEQKSFGVL